MTKYTFVSADEWYKKYSEFKFRQPTDKMLDNISSCYEIYVGIEYTSNEEIKHTTILVHVDEVHRSVGQDGGRLDTYDCTVSNLVDIEDSQIHELVELTEISVECKNVLFIDHKFL